MARDRQKAKQRRARRNPNPGPSPRALHQEDVPGSLEHASGEVEEFEAALVSGADGEAVTDRPEDDVADAEGPEDGAATVEHPEELSDQQFDDLEEEVDEDAAEEARGGAGGARRLPARRGRADGAHPERRRGNRLVGFLAASWAELQRVQWPDRRQVGQATAVVLGFVVIAGAYLGLADVVAQKIVDFII